MQLKRAEFDALVQAQIARLPAPFAAWLERVPVIVEEYPDPADVGDDDEVLGLFVGTGLDEPEGADLTPPAIYLYRQPLLDSCADRAELEAEIFITLCHELGHYAGMDEEDLEQLGYD
jgi:predicted Zn-dependent protease with MMP-like domain